MSKLSSPSITSTSSPNLTPVTQKPKLTSLLNSSGTNQPIGDLSDALSPVFSIFSSILEVLPEEEKEEPGIIAKLSNAASSVSNKIDSIKESSMESLPQPIQELYKSLEEKYEDSENLRRIVDLVKISTFIGLGFATGGTSAAIFGGLELAKLITASTNAFVETGQAQIFNDNMSASIYSRMSIMYMTSLYKILSAHEQEELIKQLQDKINKQDSNFKCYQDAIDCMTGKKSVNEVVRVTDGLKTTDKALSLFLKLSDDVIGLTLLAAGASSLGSAHAEIFASTIQGVQDSFNSLSEAQGVREKAIAGGQFTLETKAVAEDLVAKAKTVAARAEDANALIISTKQPNPAKSTKSAFDLRATFKELLKQKKVEGPKPNPTHRQTSHSAEFNDNDQSYHIILCCMAKIIHDRVSHPSAEFESNFESIIENTESEAMSIISQLNIQKANTVLSSFIGKMANKFNRPITAGTVKKMKAAFLAESQVERKDFSQEIDALDRESRIMQSLGITPDEINEMRCSSVSTNRREELKKRLMKDQNEVTIILPEGFNFDYRNSSLEPFYKQIYSSAQNKVRCLSAFNLDTLIMRHLHDSVFPNIQQLSENSEFLKIESIDILKQLLQNKVNSSGSITDLNYPSMNDVISTLKTRGQEGDFFCELALRLSEAISIDRDQCFKVIAAIIIDNGISLEDDKAVDIFFQKTLEERYTELKTFGCIESSVEKILHKTTDSLSDQSQANSQVNPKRLSKRLSGEANISGNLSFVDDYTQNSQQDSQAQVTPQEKTTNVKSDAPPKEYAINESMHRSTVVALSKSSNVDREHAFDLLISICNISRQRLQKELTEEERSSIASVDKHTLNANLISIISSLVDTKKEVEELHQVHNLIGSGSIKIENGQIHVPAPENEEDFANTLFAILSLQSKAFDGSNVEKYNEYCDALYKTLFDQLKKSKSQPNLEQAKEMLAIDLFNHTTTEDLVRDVANPECIFDLKELLQEMSRLNKIHRYYDCIKALFPKEHKFKPDEYFKICVLAEALHLHEQQNLNPHDSPEAEVNIYEFMRKITLTSQHIDMLSKLEKIDMSQQNSYESFVPLFYLRKTLHVLRSVTSSNKEELFTSTFFSLFPNADCNIPKEEIAKLFSKCLRMEQFKSLDASIQFMKDETSRTGAMNHVGKNLEEFMTHFLEETLPESTMKKIQAFDQEKHKRTPLNSLTGRAGKSLSDDQYEKKVKTKLKERALHFACMRQVYDVLQNPNLNSEYKIKEIIKIKENAKALYKEITQNKKSTKDPNATIASEFAKYYNVLLQQQMKQLGALGR
jgi:hypothetical protein